MKNNYSLFEIKKLILVSIALIILTAVSFGKSYHVAVFGDDANTGSLEAPFATIQKAASSMSPGDTCYIHEGTYYETVRPVNSGVEGSPLVFTAYRDDKVVVHGGQAITGWTKYKGSIYKAAVTENIKDLFVNRQYMLWARHPNMPYDPVKGFDMCRPTLGTANPPANVDWTGVTIVQNTNQEAWWNKFTKSNSYVSFPNDLVLGGYLMGIPGLIDSEGEWCWKDGTLYLWPIGNNDPNDLLVEAKIRDCGFDLTNRNYIVLNSITVFGATINMNGANHCVIDRCKIYYVSSLFDTSKFNISDWDNCAPMSTNLSGKGVLVGGSYNTIQNCEIAHSWGNCLSLLGSNNKVYNCHIYDANWQGYECAVLSMNGGGHVVRQNSLHDAQRSVLLCTNKYGLNPPSEPWLIESNEIYNAGLAKTDNGVIYCFMTDGVGSVISHNWIHDNYNGYSTTLHSGSGIYLDNYSSNFIVHHNVIWNIMNGHTSTGIRANNPESTIYSYGFWPNHHQIYNNTMYSCRKAINSPDNDWNGSTGRPYWNGTKIFNNITLMFDTYGPATVWTNYFGNNPQFVDPENHDFRLNPGSVCINSGTVIQGITDGYIGSAPDIGAYEYGGEEWIPGYKELGELPTSVSKSEITPLVKFRFYPNPASGELFVEPGQTTNKSYILKLFSGKGELIKTEYVDTRELYKLNLQSVRSGIYILQLLSDSGIYTEKVVIK